MPDKKQARKEIPEPVCESLLALRLADAGLGLSFALVGFFDLLVALSLHHGLAGLGLSALGGFMRQPTIKMIEEDLFHFV